MINDPTFYMLAVPVVLLVGISKGGFGGGLGVLAVPLLSLMIDPRVAAAILLPILCVMDVFSVWSFRGTWDRKNLKLLMPGALLGTLLGALTFSITNVDMIRLLVGALAIYFVAHYLWGLRMLQQAQRREPGVTGGTFWGNPGGIYQLHRPRGWTAGVYLSAAPATAQVDAGGYDGFIFCHHQPDQAGALRLAGSTGYQCPDDITCFIAPGSRRGKAGRLSAAPCIGALVLLDLLRFSVVGRN